MTSDPQFRADLYRGTAPFYDRYRPPYPARLLDDLCCRLPVTGRGRLLDLACGTGQLAGPLARHFVDVVAIDQEDDAVRFGRARSAAAGGDNIRWVTGAAESVVVEGSFELVTVGNAFHRLRRQQVADRVMSWLSPGGGLALVWAETPSEGELPWQKAMAEVFVEWMARADTADRVPAGWSAAMGDDPHEQVLRRSGFEYVGRFEFSEDLIWTVETLVGFAYSTSMLNQRALGGEVAPFEEDMAARLGSHTTDGTFRQPARFAYELARKPGSG